MAEIKTKPTETSVDCFIAAVDNEVRRDDARTISAMMQRVTGQPPRMWGPSIIGFGSYHYKYDSGHEGTMCRIGFSPRKAQQVLYVLMDRPEEAAQLARLGKHKIGKCCLYINKLADVDMAVLEEITAGCWDAMNRKYPG